VFDIDDVVKHHAAIGMRGLDDLQRRPQRGDDDGNPVLHAGFHVLHQPVVGGVADLVDGVGCDLLVRMQRLVLAEFVLDAGQPFIELFDRARVQRRERADDASLALGDHQFGSGYDEQWRSEHRQFERIGKRRWQRHSFLPWGLVMRPIIGLDGSPLLFNIEPRIYHY
jgi:hypothetical protein